jgi:hypothetical protein
MAQYAQYLVANKGLGMSAGKLGRSGRSRCVQKGFELNPKVWTA